MLRRQIRPAKVHFLASLSETLFALGEVDTPTVLSFIHQGTRLSSLLKIPKSRTMHGEAGSGTL